MLAKETAMIALTEEQRESLEKGNAVRVQENGREYVLLRPEVYDRIANGAYDDSPWARRRWIGCERSRWACSTVTGRPYETVR